MPSPTSCLAWHDLGAHRDEIAALRVDGLFAADPGRGPALTFACAGLAVDFSKQRLTAATLGHLAALAREKRRAHELRRRDLLRTTCPHADAFIDALALRGEPLAGHAHFQADNFVELAAAAGQKNDRQVVSEP